MHLRPGVISTIVPFSVGGLLISSHISSRISGFARPRFKWVLSGGQRVSRKSPVIDHLRVLNYGRLAISRVVPSVASIKRALYVEAGGTVRQVCPTEGLTTVRDHNDCAIPWHFIGVPHKFRVHSIISDKPLDLSNASCALLLIGVGPAGLGEFPSQAFSLRVARQQRKIAQRRVR